jgi:sensor histidine kinase YesM
VPLGDEWAFVQHYLGLEALRLGSRLRISTELDPDALDAVIPCFTLQPLVENAVRHGIAPLPQGGSIRVSARLDGDHVTITVCDDGCGADPRAVAGADGHGLKALRRRVEARYGPSGSLAIETAPGKGFTVVLTLPREAPSPPVSVPGHVSAEPGRDPRTAAVVRS